MQRLIAVEGYGQICMGSTLGNLAGVCIDAAGQVYGQYKGTALVQMAYQSAGSKTGRPQFTMKPGAVEGIHSSIKALGFQYGTVGADVHRQECRRSKLRMASAVFGSPSARKTVTFQPSLRRRGRSQTHRRRCCPFHRPPAACRNVGTALQFSVSRQPGVFHHLQVGQTVGIPGLFNFLHLRSRHNAMFHVGTFFLSLL